MSLSEIKCQIRSILLRAGLRRLFLKFPALKRGVRSIEYSLWRLKIYLLGRTRNLRHLDIHKLHWVSPDTIRYFYIEGSHDHQQDHGKVCEGNWDLSIRPFESFKLYRALEERYVLGKEWRDIDYIQKQLQFLSEGGDQSLPGEESWQYWGVTRVDELWERCKLCDDLYTMMRENGYIPQQDLKAEIDPREAALDEITVRIGRHGDLLFQDGRHRLMIAKLLGLPKVAIKITARHKQWMDFRRQLLCEADCNGGQVYQPLLHIDLCDIPSHHGHERFEIIQTHLDRRNGTLLDIGAHYGYFCHRFDDMGFDCVACEYSDRNVYFLTKLRDASKRRFEVFHGSVFDYSERDHFDVVLALNIFHHFLKTEEEHRRLVDFLSRMRFGVMFFEPHDPGETPMQSAFLNPRPEEFVDLILRHSNLTTAEQIGTAQDGRHLYKLTGQ